MRGKRGFAVVLAGIFACVLLGGCSLEMPKKLSDEEVVNAFLAAYQQGDYEGMKPYMSDDNQLNAMFGTIAENGEGGMAAVYDKVRELTKDIAFTATAVEGRERWGEVTVQLTTKDVSGSVWEAMDAAILAQVENGDNSFTDMPAWLLAGLESGETIEDEVTVHVGNRDGEMVMDTNTNREFLRDVTGYFYDFIDLTMTTCTSEDEVYYIVARGDDIIGMINSYIVTEDGSELTDEDLAAYEYSFASLDGVYVKAVRQGEDAVEVRLGVNFELASSTALANLGIINDRVSYSMGEYISLRATINGFEDSGMTCVTETFGVKTISQ